MADAAMDGGEVEKMKVTSSTYLKNAYRTLMLVLISTFLFADQNLLAPSLTIVAREFEIPDAEKDTWLGGYIAVGFFLVGAPVSLLIGYLVDVWNRRNLFVVTTVFGETACGLTIFAHDYWTLFFLRALTGISVGGALPLIMAMLGDMYTSDNRGKISAVVGLSLSLGNTLGQQIATVIVAGAKEGEEPDWRLPFLVVSVPSVLLSLLFYFTTEDPQRGRSEKVLIKKFKDAEAKGGSLVYAEFISWEKFKSIFSVKTNVLMIIQGIPGSTPWGVMSAYFTDFLISNRGLSGYSAVLMNTTFAVGLALGQIIGGVVGDILFRINRRYLVYFMSITAILGIYPYLVLFNVETLPWWVYGATSFPSGLVIAIAGPCIRSLLLNTTKPELRGTTFGIFNLSNDLGNGGGPFVASVIINAAGSRDSGFNYSLIGWTVCGTILFLASFTVEDDSTNVQLEMKNANLVTSGEYESLRRRSSLVPPQILELEASNDRMSLSKRRSHNPAQEDGTVVSHNPELDL